MNDLLLILFVYGGPLVPSVIYGIFAIFFFSIRKDKSLRIAFIIQWLIALIIWTFVYFELFRSHSGCLEILIFPLIFGFLLIAINLIYVPYKLITLIVYEKKQHKNKGLPFSNYT